jgi:hypothetical protein
VRNSKDIHLVTLDERALSFIKDELKNGNLLAQFLSEIKSFDEGRVTAFLPISLTSENIPEFDRSIFLETGLKLGKNAEQKVEEFITAYLQKDKSHCFVVETYYHYPKNQALFDNLAIPYFVFEDEVYFCLTESNSNVHQVLHSARDYPFVSCLSTIQQTQVSVTREFIEELSERTRFVIVKAFDAEGYYLVLDKGDELGS